MSLLLGCVRRLQRLGFGEEQVMIANASHADLVKKLQMPGSVFVCIPFLSMKIM